MKKYIKKFISILIVFAMMSAFASCQQDDYQVRLSNPNANATTVKVYEYIASLGGKYCISAQQESTWIDGDHYETDYIFNASGKYPAMRGLDYMNDDFDGVNQRAIEWWNKGGLVTICWHTGSDFYGEWSDSMNDEITDWDAVFTPDTPENKALIDGMDKAAKALKELENQGVTVLWRPFHEFDGKWFWWGKGDADNFVKLWQTMYDRYTNYWQLNNLIWVLGYSHQGEDCKDWYPGDEYCDVIGADTYEIEEHGKLYKKVSNVADNYKPLCLHECGANPTAEDLQNTGWYWFMTWHTEYLMDTNSAQQINSLYNSENIITLDELPEF